MKIALKDSFLPTFYMVIEKLGNENVYLVGGFVRDTLLQRETNDMDFACKLNPAVLHAAFPDGLFFEKFGTVSFKDGKNKVTIASFRKESDYLDYRHPQKVTFVNTIEEDYPRRDFTINCLYADASFSIIDPTKRGIRDLTNKTLCLIGNAKQRLIEDPLRILRASRFHYELSFSYDKELQEAILQQEELIGQLKKQKIMEELHKCPSIYQSEMIKELHLERYLN